jgi:hypothetical protein
MPCRAKPLFDLSFGTARHSQSRPAGACKAPYSSPSLSVISSDVLQLSKTYGKREVRVNQFDDAKSS